MDISGQAGLTQTGHRRAVGTDLLALAALGVAVFFLALISIELTQANGRVAALWPANAVVVAALLRASDRRWPRVLATGLAANIAASLVAGDPLPMAAGFSACNGLEILICAGGMRRMVGRSLDLSRVRDLLFFLGLAGLAGPLASAILGACVLGLVGGPAIPNLIDWYRADALGLLVLTPALLVMSRQALGDLVERRQAPRTLGAALLLAAGLGVVFGQGRFPAGFLMLPVLLLITFQLELVGGALALLITAVVSVSLTLGGHGVASLMPGGLGKQLLALQFFLLVQSASVLPVAAVLAERRRLVARLRAALAEAEAATAVASDSRRVAELATRIADLGHTRFDLATGESVWSEQVYVIHGFDPANRNPSRQAILDLYHPEDQALIASRMEQAWATGRGYDLKARLTRASDGSPRIVSYKGEVEFGSDGKPIALVGVLQDISEAETAHRRIEESEARFRLIAETAKDVIVKFTPSRIQYLSESARRFGLLPDDMVGRPPLELIHPDDAGRVSAAVAHMFATGDADFEHDRTFRLLTGTGDTVWMESSPSAVRGKDGQITGLIALLRDITDRKAVELALAESEARYRLMADSASDVLVHYDATGIRYVSEACRRFGYAPEDLIGRSPESLIHPDDVAKVVELNRELLSQGVMDPGRDRTSRFITASGEVVWIEGSPSIVRDAQGAPIGVINLFRDISDRVAGAHAIAESEARYRLLAENSTDVIACYGVDAVFSFMSPAIRAVLGYEPEALVGRLTFDLMHPDDVRPVAKLFADYLAAGPGADPIQFEYRARHRDGTWVWLEAHPKAIYDPVTGAFVEFQDTVREISARKALEAELREAMNQAEAATVAKSEFLSNMSHELRTPLTSIIGFASLLQDREDLPGDAPRYAARIATASSSLLALVNDILDFSKLEAGQVGLELAPTCPRDLAQDLLELFEIQASDKGVSLNLVADDDLPAGVSIDPTRVRQVMSNLVSNALKFTDRGAVTVGLSYAGSDLTVTVADTGAGVPAERLDRLFKRFSQVDASTTRTHGGTGLGLAICQGLVQAMGGEIGVTSSLGEGSVFRFRIPAPSVDLAAPAVEEEAWGASLHGARVLVADDNQANRELARAILETQGVEIMEASDGQSAVELAMSLPFDLILMDIRMPMVDGLEATRRLRAEPGPNQDIPILAFSADGDLERLKGLTEVGFDGLAHKPIVPADLIAAISGCLQGALQDVERAHAL
jgi:PAS domain S-box-containing protein